MKIYYLYCEVWHLKSNGDLEFIADGGVDYCAHVMQYENYKGMEMLSIVVGYKYFGF